MLCEMRWGVGARQVGSHRDEPVCVDARLGEPERAVQLPGG